jgi:hypothetical protein
MHIVKNSFARHLGMAFATCAVLAPALAACSSSGPPAWAAKLGSGVSVTSPQSVSAGNDSPGAAAWGYLNAVAGKTPSAACAYVQPSAQSSCHQSLDSVTQAQMGTSVKNLAIGWVAINGTKAVVGTTGTVCNKNNTPQCSSNSDPAAILDSGKAFTGLWQASVDAENSTTNVYSLGPCIEVSGKWYVYLPAA